MIPFTAQFPEGTLAERLGDKLRSEYPGILAWAVRGAQTYLRDGLGHAQAVDAATASYRSDMDTFGAFLEACCIVERG